MTLQDRLDAIKADFVGGKFPSSRPGNSSTGWSAPPPN
jgi:hypothetical protein